MTEKKSTTKKNLSENEKKATANLIQKGRDGFIRLNAIQKVIVGVGIVLVFLLAARVVNPPADKNAAYQTYTYHRGDLVAIVGATGNVEASQSAALTWQTNGRVEKVYFRVNDQVREGDILADLALNSVAQNIALAQADLISAKRGLEDVLASDSARAKAYSDLLKAEKDLKKARDDRNRWNYNNAADERIYEARALFIKAEDEFQRVLQKYSDAMALKMDDERYIEAKKAIDDARLERDKALRAVSFLLGKSYNQEVADDFAAYDLALAKAEDARRVWERQREAPNSDDVLAAEARVAAAEAALNLSRIVAPFNGKVTAAEPKVGDLVKSGQAAFQVDDLSVLFIDVNIPEIDINRIKVGQPVEITFDAILEKAYQGIVTEVGSVGNPVEGAINFKVKIRLIEPDTQIKTGMTAAVNIIVNKLENVLTVPNRAVRLKDGQRVVYVLRSGRLTAEVVKIGASSDTLTEILEGNISEGETIVLNPPIDFTSTNGGFRPPFMR